MHKLYKFENWENFDPPYFTLGVFWTIIDIFFLFFTVAGDASTVAEGSLYNQSSFFLHLNYQPTISRFYAGRRFYKIFIIETYIDTWSERVETRGLALVKRSYSSAFAEGRRHEQTRWSGCKAESRSFKEKKIEWTVAHSLFIYHLSPQITLIYVSGQNAS